MARDYGKKLASLRSRRLGLDASTTMFADSAAERFYKSEPYEKRTTGNATKYALGAMQAVDAQYTKIGIEEAERVGAQLRDGLSNEGIPVNLALQGSVPLDVHVRGGSDVDLLAPRADFLTYDRAGSGANFGRYTPYSIDVPARMRIMRVNSEQILSSRFWGATVDTTGAKSIKLSGGSLKRNIDVVPAHWHDTIAYQASQQEHDREVHVWDHRNQITVPNRPFMHIKRINDKDFETGGGIKKSIRLLKNIRNDAEEEGPKIALTSYDLASIMWHCQSSFLRHQVWQELSILASVDGYLDTLSKNYAAAATLMTPDNSRKIFDSADKFVSLVKLSAEVHALTADVAREANYLLGFLSDVSADTLRKVLRETSVAAA